MDSINSKGLPARMIPIAISVIIILVFILFTPVPSSGDAPFYSIALSRFSSEEAAKKEEASLKNSGNNAFYRKEKNPESGKIEYQVYIERYSSMEEATKEAKVLKDLELIPDYLVKKVVDTPVIEELPPETKAESTEEAQPVNDIKQVSEENPGVPENKAPETESKIVEGQAPPTAKKDTEAKIPETVTHEQVLKTPATEQENRAGQVIRGTIPSQKKTVKQDAAPEKPEGQVSSTDQSAAANEPVTEKVTEKKESIKNESIDQPKGATLQVGAYKEEANAAILKKQLTSLGRTAFYRPETVEGKGDLYRIYITGYKTLGEAVKDAKTLVESGVITDYARTSSKFTSADIPLENAGVAENEKDGRIFFLHTGSFKEEVNAQRAVASLKGSGYKAFLVPEKEPSVTWYRVYIGDFRSEVQAREKGMELLDKEIITYFKPVSIDPQENGN
ncbi:MAG: SPOR domain-containing protein [Deltaproteobacteria bacterium]|nr:SPOR domain-containing protein [Deltaproteobacteria bacterium]